MLTKIVEAAAVRHAGGTSRLPSYRSTSRANIGKMLISYRPNMDCHGQRNSCRSTIRPPNFGYDSRSQKSFCNIDPPHVAN
jgi:hypothetical protein